MNETVTAARMRDIEHAAIASGAVTGLELMELAGSRVVEAIFEEWPELRDKPRRALVLAGPGNNGGDGYVVARLLTERGWDVLVRCFGDPERLPPDALANYERWRGIGTTDTIAEGQDVGDADLFVDALFGIGQTRALPAVLQEFAARLATIADARNVRRVAIDIPSGLDSDTGEPFGEHQFFSDLTVTFHRLKPCHVDERGKKRAGRVVVKDIGL